MSTTRKTKTNTPTAAELARQALAEAESVLAVRVEQQEQAHAAVEELGARLFAGDDAVTDAELAFARVAIDRRAILVQGAEARVQRARAALINDDLALAELFADILGKTFEGQVPVKVTGVPTDAHPNPDGGPVVWIMQEKPTTKVGGIVSGLLDVTLYRPRWFVPLDGRELEARCRAAGFAVTLSQVSEGPAGEGMRSAVRLNVHRAFAPVPELSAAPTEEAAREFGYVVNAALGQAIKDVRPRAGIAVSAGQEPAIRAEMVGCRIISSVPGEDGTTRVTLKMESKVRPGAGLTHHYANQRLRGALADQVQTVAEGVGRVLDVEAVEIDMPDPTPQTAGRPWEVSARFTLAHRLA